MNVHDHETPREMTMATAIVRRDDPRVEIIQIEFTDGSRMAIDFVNDDGCILIDDDARWYVDQSINALRIVGPFDDTSIEWLAKYGALDLSS